MFHLFATRMKLSSSEDSSTGGVFFFLPVCFSTVLGSSSDVIHCFNHARCLQFHLPSLSVPATRSDLRDGLLCLFVCPCLPGEGGQGGAAGRGAEPAAEQPAAAGRVAEHGGAPHQSHRASVQRQQTLLTRRRRRRLFNCSSQQQSAERCHVCAEPPNMACTSSMNY